MQYPREVLKIIAPQVLNARDVLRYQLARRHTEPARRENARSWISEIRRLDRAGYSRAVQLLGLPLPTYRQQPAK